MTTRKTIIALLAAVAVQCAIVAGIIWFLLYRSPSSEPAQPSAMARASANSFAVSLPSGARQGGGAGMRTGGTQALQGDGFIMKLDHANAPGFKPASPDGEAGTSMQDGKRVMHKWTLAQFADFIQGALGTPVIDQTGLTGEYDFELSPPRRFALDVRTEKVKESLLNELGLKLVPNPEGGAKK